MKSPLVVVGCLVLMFGSAGCANMLERPREALERRITFFPRKLSKDAPAPKGVESVWFKDEDPGAGNSWRLHGLFIEAPDRQQRRAVILYCHGNRGCVDTCAPKIIETAQRFNVAVLAFDYRGFGRSEGLPNEEGVTRSARAARRWLAGRTGVSEASIVLMGHSLGGGVAVDLAGRDGCRGLILESTFTSVSDVVDSFTAPVATPSRWIKLKLNSLETIKNYHGPLLQRHGDADPLVAFEQGKKLFDAAPGPKRFVATPGGMHRDPPTPAFYEAMDEFINALPAEEHIHELHQLIERVWN